MEKEDLSEYMYRERSQLPKYAMQIIVMNVALGLQHLHGRGFYHRDIKAENILVSESGQIKISDFGGSFRMTSRGWAYGQNGTTGYMAQEVRPSAWYFGAHADAYSLGCLGNWIIMKRRTKPNTLLESIGGRSPTHL
ncbi:G protein-coupled receptor kinase 5 [Mortierella sp. 14UC]|nr:G protein-coupled receptor kinase 5 [Mortierella sp. 14UC]